MVQPVACRGVHRRLEALPEPGVAYDDAPADLWTAWLGLDRQRCKYGMGPQKIERMNRVLGLLGFFCRSILKPQQAHLELVSG